MARPVRCLTLVLLILVCVSPVVFATEFASPAAYAVGSGPQTVVVGDFNGDGKLDLAVLNTVSNNVTILLGNGDGTFQTATNFDAGASPSSLATGDFNGDGKLDLAVFVAGNASTSTAGAIRILLGKGDGTFQVPVATTLPDDLAVAFAVGDFNGDKNSDVIVGNVNASAKLTTLEILVGKGDGTFQAPKAIPFSGLASPQVAVADFNKDGKLDLAVNGLGGVVLLAGQGDGTFVAGTSARALAVGTAAGFWTADVNNDGNLDLIVDSRVFSCSGGGFIHICGTSQDIGVFLGDGKGSFAAEQVFATGRSIFGANIIASIAVGDFNGDGKLDVAYRQKPLRGTLGLQIRLGKADGTFATAIPFPDPGIEVSAAADFNGDKLSDLVALDSANGNVDVFLNDSPGSGTDLGIITSSQSPEPVGVGQNLTYTADVMNEGPKDATGVTFTDTLPANVTLVSVTASQGSCSSTSSAVTCAMGALTDTSDVSVTIVVTPNSTGSITNTMKVSGNETDAANENNTMTQTSTILPIFTLTVTKSGSGSGTTASDQGLAGGINCGSTCSAKFLGGTQVNVTASADPGNFFISWGGACSGSGFCVVTMSADQTVNVNFAKGNTLSVTLAGSGGGSVQDQGAAIFVCTSTNGDCSPALLPGSTISIQAIPSGNSVFAGWSGACTGTDPNMCNITMSANEMVTATFNPPPDFTVTPAAPGLTLQAGSKVSEVLSFAAQGGFSSAILLACSVSGTTNGPMPTCLISPNSVNVGKNATLTVDASGLSTWAFPFLPYLNPLIYLYCAALAALSFLLAAVRDRRRRSWVLASFLLALSGLPAACGGSSGPPPPKNFRVTVTATSGAIQHLTVISVTLN